MTQFKTMMPPRTPQTTGSAVCGALLPTSGTFYGGRDGGQRRVGDPGQGAGHTIHSPRGHAFSLADLGRAGQRLLAEGQADEEEHRSTLDSHTPHLPKHKGCRRLRSS